VKVCLNEKIHNILLEMSTSNLGTPSNSGRNSPNVVGASSKIGAASSSAPAKSNNNNNSNQLSSAPFDLLDPLTADEVFSTYLLPLLCIPVILAVQKLTDKEAQNAPWFWRWDLLNIPSVLASIKNAFSNKEDPNLSFGDEDLKKCFSRIYDDGPTMYGCTSINRDLFNLSEKLHEAHKKRSLNDKFIKVNFNIDLDESRVKDGKYKAFVQSLEINHDYGDSPVTGISDETRFGGNSVEMELNICDVLDVSDAHTKFNSEYSDNNALKLSLPRRSIRARFIIGGKTVRNVKIPVACFEFLAWFPSETQHRDHPAYSENPLVNTTEDRVRVYNRTHQEFKKEDFISHFGSRSMPRPSMSPSRVRAASRVPDSLPPLGQNPTSSSSSSTAVPTVVFNPSVRVDFPSGILDSFNQALKQTAEAGLANQEKLRQLVEQFTLIETSKLRFEGLTPTEYLRKKLKDHSLEHLFHYLSRTVISSTKNPGRPHREHPLVPTTHSGDKNGAQLLYHMQQHYIVSTTQGKDGKDTAIPKKEGQHVLGYDIGLQVDFLCHQLSLLLLTKKQMFDYHELKSDHSNEETVAFTEMVRSMDYSIQTVCDHIFDHIRKYEQHEYVSKTGENTAKNPAIRSLLMKLRVPGNIYPSPSDLVSILPVFDLSEGKAAVAAANACPTLFLRTTGDLVGKPPVPSSIVIPAYEVEELTGSASQMNAMFRVEASDVMRDFKDMMPDAIARQSSRSPPSLLTSGSGGSLQAASSALPHLPLSVSPMSPTANVSPVPVRPTGIRGTSIGSNQLNPYLSKNGLASDDQDCYLCSALAIHHAVTQFPCKKNLSPVAALFLSKSTPEEVLRDKLASIAGVARRGEPNDAVVVLKSFLEKAPFTDVLSFSDVFAVSEFLPKDCVAHGALVYDTSASPGHWSLMMQRPGRDRIARTALSPAAWFWMDDRREDIQYMWKSGEKNFGLPTDVIDVVAFFYRKPLLGLGVDDVCSQCNKNAHAHSHESLSRKCKSCSKLFMGLCCLPLSSRKNDPAIQSLLSESLFTHSEPEFVCYHCNPDSGIPKVPADGKKGRGRVLSAAAGLKALGRAAAPPAKAPAKLPAAAPPALPPAPRNVGKKHTNNPYKAVAQPPPAAGVLPPPPPRAVPAAPVGVVAPTAALLPPPPPPYRRHPAAPTADERYWSLPASPGLDPPQDFLHPRASTPYPGVQAGVILSNLRMNPFVNFNSPLHPQTVKYHFKYLQDLLEDFALNNAKEPRWSQTPLPQVIEAFLLHRAKLRNWKPQSLHRNAATMHGAFSNLPLYTNSPEGMNLGESPFWRLAMSRLKQDANKAQPRELPAVDVEDINLAISSCGDLRTQVALVLQWYLGARVGDILRLRLENVVVHSNNCLQVRIDNGKVMAKRTPYTVHSFLPPAHSELLKEYYRRMETLTRDPKAPLFPTTGPPHPLVVPWVLQQQRMRAALRMSNPTLNTRAIRRGALQTMAKAGVPTETLMMFSGHTNVETLKRYLDYGRHLGTAKVAGQQAATLLAHSSQH
jgi:integrase